MNDTFDATLKYCNVEADEQTEAKPSGFQVQEGLGDMNGRDAFACLQLDDEVFQLPWRSLRLGGSPSPIDTVARRVAIILKQRRRIANEFRYFCGTP